MYYRSNYSRFFLLFFNEILCKERSIVLLSSKTNFLWQIFTFLFELKKKTFFSSKYFFSSKSTSVCILFSALILLQLKIFSSSNFSSVRILLHLELFSSSIYSFTSNSFFQLKISSLNSKFLLLRFIFSSKLPFKVKFPFVLKGWNQNSESSKKCYIKHKKGFNLFDVSTLIQSVTMWVR